MYGLQQRYRRARGGGASQSSQSSSQASLARRSYVKGRRRVTRPVRSIPEAAAEVKQTHNVLALTVAAAGADPYTFSTAFGNVYPSTWSTVDTAPGQGNTSSTRVGNAFNRKRWACELVFNVDPSTAACTSPLVARFVVFEWLNAVGPDTAVWMNPLGTVGAGFNPFFAAKSNVNYRVLAQRTHDFNLNNRAGAAATNTGSDGALWRVALNLKCPKKVLIDIEDEATAIVTATVTDTVSYAGRIYWCIVTNFGTTTIGQVAGHYGTFFTDE